MSAVGDQDVERVCRVCGFEEGERWDSFGLATFEICSCCGCESGYEDISLQAVRTFRDEWLKRGAPWFWPKARPKSWDVSESMRNVPERFL